MIDQLIAQLSDQDPIRDFNRVSGDVADFIHTSQEPVMSQTSSAPVMSQTSSAPVMSQTSSAPAVTRDEFEVARCLQRVNRSELHTLRREVDKMKETIRNLTMQNKNYQDIHADLLGKIIGVGKRTKHLENIVAEHRLRIGRLKSVVYTPQNGSRSERYRSRSRGRYTIQRRSRSRSPLRML